MNSSPLSSGKDNLELEFYARLSKEWLQSKPILKCKICGSNIDFFVNSMPNEWGHYVYVWSEDCGKNRHISELQSIVRLKKSKRK